jgi:hypothetical protein
MTVFAIYTRNKEMSIILKKSKKYLVPVCCEMDCGSEFLGGGRVLSNQPQWITLIIGMSNFFSSSFPYPFFAIISQPIKKPTSLNSCHFVLNMKKKCSK